jgi:hypothetical protein
MLRVKLIVRSEGFSTKEILTISQQNANLWLLQFTILVQCMRFWVTGLQLKSSGHLTICKTRSSGETMVGRLGPYTSASNMPTLAPIPASEYAKFTAIVDFPTPPWSIWYYQSIRVQHPAVLSLSNWNSGSLTLFLSSQRILMNTYQWSKIVFAPCFFLHWLML